MENKLTFNELVASIQQVHEQLAAQAGKAVNISLTMRNWAIGCYIREYEQNGADRAEYGANLLDTLNVRLTKAGMKGMAPRTLRQYRQFYLIYPQIRQTVSAKSPQGLLSDPIWQSLSAKSAERDATAIQGTLSPELIQPGKELLERLSFFLELDITHNMYQILHQRV